MFFDSWYGVLRVVVLGVCAYAMLLVLVRISGKRTLAKLNAFDLVVTVALGSTLATVLLSSTVSLAEGVTALATLVGLQYAVAWTSVRSGRIGHLMRSEPTMIVYRGQLLTSAMRRERITEAEVRQVLRQQGTGSVADVGALVLETDGSFSLVAAGTSVLDHLPDPDARAS